MFKMNLPQIALYQPEIPQNTGTLIRLSACLGIPLNIIHPCGFVMSDKQLQRSGLDYHELSVLHHHQDFPHFLEHFGTERVVVLTPTASQAYFDYQFQPGQVLLFGRESDGFPKEISDQIPTHLTIPMLPNRRSLNLALSASMVVGEALRQLSCFPR